MLTTPADRRFFQRNARIMRRMTFALACAGLGALGGCYFEGGQLFSMDSPTYRSTTWQPKTISIVDTSSGETIWTVDVPVGQQVVMDFMENEGPSDAYPDVLRWAIMPIGSHLRDLSNRQPMPGKQARRTEVTLRPTPEYASDDLAVDQLRPAPADASETAPAPVN